MKKSLIVLLAFLVVGALAFAAEPTAELKITEFTGNASVTLGFDIDTGVAAFTNATSVSLKLQLLAGGDKSTTGEGIWGLLKIKTADNDNVIRISGSPTATVTGPNLSVDTAQLMFGTIAYLGIKQDGTQLNYSKMADEAAGFYTVNTAKFYGVLNGTTLVADDGKNETGVNAPYGVVLGLTPAGIGTFTVDFRSVPQWKAADPYYVFNQWGVRAKADITAVANLTAQAGVAYSFGPGAAEGQDIGFGGKIAYKVALGDPMFVQPKVAFDVNYDVSDFTGDDAVLSFSAQAGALFGWGAKSKMSLFFSPDSDNDWGYYPGIAAGVIIADPNASDTGVGTDSMTVGLNVSAFAGTLVPNLGANLAFEIENLLADDMDMGISANLKYDVLMAPMTLTPKFGLSYRSDAAAAGDAATDIYVKAGLDIAKIFPNTTLSFLYESNDFQGGVNNDGNHGSIGAFSTTLKIAF